MGDEEALQQKARYLADRIEELELVVAAARRFLASVGKTRFEDMVEYQQAGQELAGLLARMEGRTIEPRIDPELPAKDLLWVSLEEFMDGQDRADGQAAAAARLVLEELLEECSDPQCSACRRLRVVQVVLGESGTAL